MCWPKEARPLVMAYLKRVRYHLCDDQRAELKSVITQLVSLTGYSRDRCLRFARRLGVKGKLRYTTWTRSDQQRLLDLLGRNPPCEVARIMGRTPSSVRAMMHRLGASAQMGRNWFTVYTLAESLHSRPAQVQTWIDRGWLKTRMIQLGKLEREVIEREAFVEFCQAHAKDIVGHRLRLDRIDFVKDFVFAPSHKDLLPVRESKKERAAFDLLMSQAEDQQVEDSRERQDLNLGEEAAS